MSEGMGRAPVLFFMSIVDAVAFYKRLPSLEAQLRKDAEATSRFASLLRITGHIMGSSVHVHFEYKTGDAAGQNMTEFATMAACTKLLESDLGKELKIVKVIPEGNMTSDKCAAAAMAIRNPRGVRVMAWGNITPDICRKILRCDPAELYQSLKASRDGDIRNQFDGGQLYKCE